MFYVKNVPLFERILRAILGIALVVWALLMFLQPAGAFSIWLALLLAPLLWRVTSTRSQEVRSASGSSGAACWQSKAHIGQNCPNDQMQDIIRQVNHNQTEQHASWSKHRNKAE